MSGRSTKADERHGYGVSKLVGRRCAPSGLLVLFYQLLVRFSAVLEGTSDPGQWRRRTITQSFINSELG